MQRDMKIGMALGVALVGIVGALFFRREPEVKDKETPPPLQNAEELDREFSPAFLPAGPEDSVGSHLRLCAGTWSLASELVFDG